MPQRVSSRLPRQRQTRCPSPLPSTPTASLSARSDPARALDAVRRGLIIAQDSGNRYCRKRNWRSLWDASQPTTATLHPRSITSLWRSATCHDAGNTTNIKTHWPPLRLCSTGSDATSRRPPSPVSRSAPSPHSAIPEINTAITHLRDVLGDQTYESLARKGETMTTADMVTYAYDQIDQARAELNAVSK